MTIFYMRHGKDTREDGYSHDEILTDEGKEEVRQFTRDMVNKNGIPEVIYCSIFYRCRQTAKEMYKLLKEEYQVKPKIKFERKLGRYFAKEEKYNPGLHRSTLKQKPIIHESHEEFKERTTKFHLNILDKHVTEGSPNIWLITHSLVIIRVLKHHNIQRSYYIQYLDTVEVPK